MYTHFYFYGFNNTKAIDEIVLPLSKISKYPAVETLNTIISAFDDGFCDILLPYGSPFTEPLQEATPRFVQVVPFALHQ